MIDFILALIDSVISFNTEYNATHLLPLSAALFTLAVFTVFMPLMMYMMRETPEATIERVSGIIAVYDNAVDAVTQAHAAGNYSQARYEVRMAELHTMRQPFVEELEAALAAVAAKGDKQ